MLAYLVRRFIAIERATSITQISTSNNLDLESQEHLTGLKWSKIFLISTSTILTSFLNTVPKHFAKTLHLGHPEICFKLRWFHQ